jgi:transposase-like protein
VALVTSDAHRGLTDAIGATLPGAAWQRCRTHYADLGIMPTGVMEPLVAAV